MEVLVSLIIFSLGMLGLARLQLAAVQYNTNAYLRTAAVIKAEDITERMRANMLGLVDGDYNVGANDGTETAACLGLNADANEDADASCTAAQIAAHDLYEWQQDIADNFPNGQGAVCRDSTPDDGTPDAPECDNLSTDVYAIKIWWDEKINSPTEDTSFNQERFVLTVKP